jgi:hypothetical protein
MYQNSILREAALNPIWQEENGLVLIDIASIKVREAHSKAMSFKGVWNEWAADDAAGATGKGAYRWGGPDLTWNPGSGILAFRIHIRRAGRYLLALRSRRTPAAIGTGDDCFIRIDGGQWWITRGHAGENWGWNAEYARSAETWETAAETFEAGFHQIEISGRSHGFSIDRLAVAAEGVAFTDPALPFSLPRPR